MTQKICLAMIVKDEAAVIERCLYSVLPYIDMMSIVDTGSTDGTQDIIRSFMEAHQIDGYVIDRPWVDFAHNRTEALAYARNANADYTLMIDADDVLAVPTGFQWPELTCDCYDVKIRHVTIEFPRTQIFRNDAGWFYRGVLHEFPECPKPKWTRGELDLLIQTSRSGNRSQDPEKYHKDAVILENAINDGKDPDLLPRYTFYLAQSYRDAGDIRKAFASYLARTDMGGYRDEIYYSMYQAMKLAVGIGMQREVIERLYQAASLMHIGRAEHAHFMGYYYRSNNMYSEAVDVLDKWQDAPYPHSALFGEPWIYHYGILDELSVSQFWAGQPHNSLATIVKLLQRPKMPPHVLERVAENAKLTVLRLGS